MSEVSEMLEHAEHAAHGGHGDHGGGNAGKMIGLTMAILGVLLAFCAAQVGAARTELIKTMVEQTNANAEQQAQSTKYRMLFSQLEQLRAIAPTNEQVADLHKKLDTLKAAAHPEQADAVAGAVLVGVGVSEMIQPTPQPLARLIGLTRKAGYKTGLAHHWTEAFEPAISAYSNQAEGFEHGQLCAEIGIVLASIALLMQNKKAWGGSIALGVLCAGLVGFTFVTERPKLHAAEATIEEAHHHYEASASGAQDHADDEDTLKALSEGMGPDLLKIASGGVPAAGEGHGAAPAHGGDHAAPAHGGDHAAPAHGGDHAAPEHGGEHAPAPAEHH
jgi:Domain of unknown function (DUF4337)